jgi:hypothetical protein
LDKSALRYVLFGALLLGLLAPGWLALEYESAEVKVRLSESLQRDANRHADMLSVALREPLWQLAPAFGKPLVDTIMEDPRVARIVVSQAPMAKSSWKANGRRPCPTSP